MADLRTTITEVVTGLGMTGVDDVDAGLAARPEPLVDVSPSVWDELAAAWSWPANRQAFVAAWTNGRRFLEARDGLRGRTPLLIEWKGSHRAPGDEVVPADLRVDHVYLVSCKYLSQIVINASPAHLFERLLAGGHGARGTDWYQAVARDEHDALYAAVRKVLELDELPDQVTDLVPADRRVVRDALRGRAWPTPELEDQYAQLSDAVAFESAKIWRAAMDRDRDRERMLWRLLRIGSAPYFVLGSSPRGSLRLRIATPWDWRQEFELRAFEVEARPGGQPMVGWRAVVRRRKARDERTVEGRVEIRWSHGRFGGPPEAKVYLHTPHAEVPGYFPLA
jgi:hypothetical protein